MSQVSGAGTQVSVIVATYNRLDLLKRLLRQLDVQTLDPKKFEVVVCDDGGRENVPEALAGVTFGYRLVPLRQPNAGPAAARHKAIENAQGRVLVIVDDDMQVQPTFLEEHLKMHPLGTRRAALGRLEPDSHIADMPYFERWYAAGHKRTADRARAGQLKLDGYSFYTGNVSLLRQDYLDIGGFDFSLRLGEDTDLGLRLEASGVELTYTAEAVAYHASDHASEKKWLERVHAYGVNYWKIGKKHHDVPHANALRYLFEMNLLARPLVASTLLMPDATRPLSDAALGLTKKMWELGIGRVAHPLTSVVYTMEFMRGVRSQTGSLPDTARAIVAHFFERLRP
ncbi:MAG: glycosyltransferase family 2 protein [Myxococcaceae bacterium]|nr:glycosyltransferase family 2 protein [Myxococcaceae bacterium]